MASKVSIANRALTKLGAERVLLLEDDTQQSRVLKSMFDDVRDAEIRRHRWKFAIKRAELLALADGPGWGYSFQYPLPSDYLGLIQVGEQYVRLGRKAPWSVESGNILTNLQAPLRIRYQYRVENPGLYDPLFVEVLACKLALEACETLTQSGSKKQAAMEEYKFAISEAVRQDAIENPPDELPQGSWLDAHSGGVHGDDAGSWASYPSGVRV